MDKCPSMVHLGFDRWTCEAEVSQGIAAGLPFKQGAFTAWGYDVDLEAVINLNSTRTRTKIGVTKAEITERGNHETASGIGEHLHKRGDIQAIAAPSAQLEDGKCLDVFLDRVNSPSKVAPSGKIGICPSKINASNKIRSG